MAVINDNKRKLVFIAALFLSGIFAVVAVIRESFVFAFFSLPGLIFLMSLLHEAGHYFACLLSKQEFKELVLFFISLSKQGIRFIDDFPAKSYCVFSSGKHDAFIYAAGPVSSFLTVLIITVFAFIAKNRILFLYCICSFIHLVFNLIPRPGNDTACLMRILRERN